MTDVSKLLDEYSNGNRDVLNELLPIVYNELRRLAHSFLARERSGMTLQTTALVHEAYMKLVDQHSVDFRNRAQFFALSAQSMRRILLDNARSRAAQKRGNDGKVSIDDVPEIAVDVDCRLLDLDVALKELETFDPIQAKVVELRYFGGLTIEQTAEVMNISPATVKREWTLARAWLFDNISS